MPSKFVAKAFVCDEIAKSTEKTKQEIIDSAVKEIEALESGIPNLKRTQGHHDNELGMIVEGSIRRHVALEKGDDWANG